MANHAEIGRFLSILHQPGSVFEVRVPSTVDRPGNSFSYTSSGYFDDIDKAVDEIAALDDAKRAAAIYVTLNPVNEALLARANNRLRTRARETSKDADVICRRWILIDFDPVRPGGISSTDAELQQSQDRAIRVKTYLAELGWPESLMVMSGNGAHLLYRITDDAGAHVEACLKGLARKFDDDAVVIDTSVYNPARITKVAGTWVRKGDDLAAVNATAKRPHRCSRIVSGPEGQFATVGVELVQAIAAKNGIPVPVKTIPSKPDQFYKFEHTPRGVRQYLEDHGVKVRSNRSRNGTSLLILERCPIDPECASTGSSDIAVLIDGDGRIGYANKHDRGDRFTWADVRDALEPGYKQWSEAHRDGSNLVGSLTSPFGKHDGDSVCQDPQEAILALVNSGETSFRSALKRLEKNGWSSQELRKLEKIRREAQDPSSNPAKGEIDGSKHKTLAEDIASGVLSVSETSGTASYLPFPVPLLPAPVSSYIESAAAATGCDPAYIAVPMLATLAAAIGNTWSVELKRLWREPCVVWTITVGESGTMKSPGIDLATSATRRRQSDAIAKHREDMQEYEDEKEQYAIERKKWITKKHGDPPAKPHRPICPRILCNDITIEALAERLSENPRGILLVREEMAGWLQSFDQYRKGRGGDVAHWLSIFGARELIVDRKSSEKSTIHIPHAAVSITGGIQPEVLRVLLGREHFDNGLASRMLLAMPPRRAKIWTEKEVDPAAATAVESLINKLYDMPTKRDTYDRLLPKTIKLDAGAHREFVTFYDTHNRHHLDLAGDAAAASAKLEGYAPRLALVIHFVRWAASDASLKDHNVIDEDSMRRAIGLCHWFGNELSRIYSVLNESETDRRVRRLAEQIQIRGGSVSIREWQRIRNHGSSGAAKAELDMLQDLGIGRMTHPAPGKKGGRPLAIFVISRNTDTDKTPSDTPAEVVCHPEPLGISR